MKTLKNLKIYVIALTLLAAYSCSNDDNPPEGTNLYDLIVSSSTEAIDFGTFVDALQRTGLDMVLEENGTNYTVFVPDNNAFTEFFSENGYGDLNGVPDAVLEQLLRNHIIEGNAVSSTTLISQGSGYLPTQAQGPSTANICMFFYDNDGALEINGEVSITDSDREASNGIFHVVEVVIDIPSVLTFIDSDPNLSGLSEAVGLVDPTYSEDFANLEALSAPYTILAPDNAAIQDALDNDFGVASLGDLDSGDLQDILDLHIVIENNVLSGDLTDGMVITTANGDVNVTVDGSTVTMTDAGGRETMVIMTNVQAGNGVIHVVDRLLLPL